MTSSPGPELSDATRAAIRARARELAAAAPTPTDDDLAALRALLCLGCEQRRAQRPAPAA